jgi:hypothetical protein
MKNQSESVAIVEVLRPADLELRRGPTSLETLDALVQQRVAEVFAERDEFIFEPFFRTRQVATEIRRLQTVPERKKWAVYFERHGCVSCLKRDQPYASSGFCNTCHARVFRALKAIVSEPMKPEIRSESVAAVEVLRPVEIELRRRPTNMETLDALVQQRVAEVFAERDEFIFEPFFRTRQVATEIRRLQTVPERRKWSIYFERHGCVSCLKRDQPYASSGFCNKCHARVFRALRAIVSELTTP